MILLLITLILFIGSIACWIIHARFSKLYENERYSFDRPDEYWNWDRDKRIEYDTQRAERRKKWETSNKYKFAHWCWIHEPIVQTAIVIITSIILVIMLLVGVISYSIMGAEIALLQARYDSLTYQLENDVYNDNGDDVIGKSDLYAAIQEWNEDYAWGIKMQNNPWTGIFIPDKWDYLKPIELK